MAKYLLIFSSVDGQTKKICDRLHLNLKNNYNSKVASLEDAEAEELSSYDFIIIGASIRYGKHRSNLYKFIKKNISILEKKNNAFFTVNVVARKENKSTPDTNPYMQKFLKTSEWRPKNLAVFAGKIEYKKYNFFDKHIIRFIMWLTKGPTNTKESYDFTNWKNVDNFCKKISL
tara:strand:- start:123 stop:644 length:522 start_codon:yes stop_codon:yes gene_type:complete